MAQTSGFVCLECGWEGPRSDLTRGEVGLRCPECDARLF